MSDSIKESQHFALEQQMGFSPSYGVRQDRARVGYVRTISGQKVLLAVVADGEDANYAAQAAEMVVGRIFEAVSQSHTKDLGKALVRGLIAGNESISRAESRVATTAVAIQNNRLYFAHAGHCAAYLVRKGETIPLTQSEPHLLGASSAPNIDHNASQGMLLQPNDHIVLVSDGLTKINPADGKPFVETTAIAEYVEGSTPREAARHLISLAMGRDADDNLTAIVIRGSKGDTKKKRHWAHPVIFASFVIVLSLLALRISLSQDKESAAAVDAGYAVSVSGAASIESEGGGFKSLGRLSAIPPQVFVLAEEPVRLALRSGEETSTDLSAASVYLDTGCGLRFLMIDPVSETHSEATEIKKETIFYLASGRVLIARGAGSRVFKIEFEGGFSAIQGVGRAMMGVEALGESIQVDCLEGNCFVHPQGGEMISFQGGERLSIIGVSPGLPERISDSIFFAWDELCAGCLSVP